MATARETIITGLEALRVIGMGQNPPSAMATYCLRQLNNYIAQIGGMPMRNVSPSSGYTISRTWPAMRVLCQAGCRSVILPQGTVPDGTRVEVVDAANSAATSNITISGNGWKIGAASSLTINTNGGSVLLMFRTDLGRWVEYDDLGLDDDIPFPRELNQAIALNAAKTYTRFGQSLSAEDAAAAIEGARQLRARYRKPPPFVHDAAVSNISGEDCVAYSDDEIV